MKRTYILLIGLVFTSSLFSKLNILFLLNRFPWPTKSIILNQIVGLKNKEHCIDVFSRDRVPEHKVDQKFYQYSLSSNIYYETLPKDVSKYDVVIAQYGDLGKKFMYIKEQYPHIKYIVCLRGSDITSNKNYYDKEYQKLFEMADLFLPVCNYFKYRLETIGCPKGKIQVVRSPIDVDFFVKKEMNKKKKFFDLITVCRLSPKKGTIFLLQAFLKLARKNKLLRLHIVGEGGQRKVIELFIKKYGLSKKVFLHGLCDHVKVKNLLSQSDLFVLPSVTTGSGLQEGIANALKEAMMMRLPVIATFHAGNIELIENGKEGYLVPERSVDDLAKKISILVKNRKLAQKMGEFGMKKVKDQYSIKTIVDQLEEILLDLVSSKVM